MSGASVNIPQANSIETLVYVVEAIADDVTSVADLVVEFDVRERTIHYYLELAEWLGLVEDRKAAALALTQDGAKFAAEVGARAEIYDAALKRHDIVNSALSRSQSTDFKSLRAAFVDVVMELDVLAEATAKRRAGALATLVSASVNDEVDWRTGRVGQPTRMKRTFRASDSKSSRIQVDESAPTTSWERAREPEQLVGAERADELRELIASVLRDCGPLASARIRDELAMQHGVPLTDPTVFVVLRDGLSRQLWRADANGAYALYSS
jgi:hypothetical protein